MVILLWGQKRRKRAVGRSFSSSPLLCQSVRPTVEDCVQNVRRFDAARASILPFIVSGSIQITEAALASLIGLTAHEIPGVVGMAPANLREGIARVLGRANASDGVLIGKEGGRFTADLYIVAAYGVSIPRVAENIHDRVIHTVKAQAGIDLAALRIHAVGVQRV